MKESSLANLIPFKKGQSGNPKGRPKGKAIAAWLAGAVKGEDGAKMINPETNEEYSRFDIQMNALFSIASDSDHPGCVKANELLWSYVMYKKGSDPTILEYAEHLRKIDADRFAMGTQLLGERAKTMTDAEAAAFLRSCAQNADAYLKMAQQIMDERNGDTSEQPTGEPPAAIEPEPEPQAISGEPEGDDDGNNIGQD